MQESRKIAEATIVEASSGLGLRYAVEVVFDDGEHQRLFSYFPGEIQFTEDELIGLTADEATELHFRRDLAYLRS
jgi:hypothetical protein